MKKKIVYVVSRIVQDCNKLLVALRLVNPKVIICVDGGICSQMVAYLRGRYYSEVGFMVYYDLRWFQVSAKDTDGKFDRPFELQTMYPKLSIPEPSTLIAWFYRHFMKPISTINKMPLRENLKQSLYLNYYPDFPDGLWFVHAIQKYLALENAKEISLPYKVDEKAICCSVHMRRGDMSYVKMVGYENSIEYFVFAMRYVQQKHNNSVFILFSDEPRWVKDEVLPLVKDLKVEVISGNMGHEDLLLCAQNPIIIASQGTMGRMAGMLNPKSELIIPPTGDWGAFPIERYRTVTILHREMV